MNSAQLIKRGEQFEVVVGKLRFDGECVWSWDDRQGDIPLRVYPIQLLAKSIRLTGTRSGRPLSELQRVHVVMLAKQVMEANSGGCYVEVLDD